MSLDKCSSNKVFLFKRWIRLFPAMFISTILIFTTSSFLDTRPAGVPELTSLIPGLTFIEPLWWSKLLGINVVGLEGAFWSIYVEFKFYIVCSLVFFYLGRDKLVFTLLLLYVGSNIIAFSVVHIDNVFLHFAHNVSKALSLRYFGWFSAGAAFYLFHNTRKKSWFYLGVFISLLSAIAIRKDFSIAPIVGAVLVSALFSISLISTRLQSILRSKFLLLFGLVSYPLYLIHDNAMISMITISSYMTSSVPGYLVPVLPVIILTGTSYLIVKYGEPRLKKIIVSHFENKSK